MARRKALNRLHRLVHTDQLFPGKHPLQQVYLVWLQMRNVGQSAVLDLAAFAVTLPQQHCGFRLPVGYDGNVHACIVAASIAMSSYFAATYMTTIPQL